MNYSTNQSLGLLLCLPSRSTSHFLPYSPSGRSPLLRPHLQKGETANGRSAKSHNGMYGWKGKQMRARAFSVIYFWAAAARDVSGKYCSNTDPPCVLRWEGVLRRGCENCDLWRWEVFDFGEGVVVCCFESYRCALLARDKRTWKIFDSSKITREMVRADVINVFQLSINNQLIRGCWKNDCVFACLCVFTISIWLCPRNNV